ncbi:MAG: preprotein translocase subunit TatB [Desulfovibrio sp.]|nr:MAG: preprotein translocase subunit TatB [Desulfovibrio sp.]
MSTDTTKTVDARGLSCPQPVILTLDAIKNMASGTVTVLVDTDASRENVARAAGFRGWNVAESPAQDDATALTLTK